MNKNNVNEFINEEEFFDKNNKSYVANSNQNNNLNLRFKQKPINDNTIVSNIKLNKNQEYNNDYKESTDKIKKQIKQDNLNLILTLKEFLSTISHDDQLVNIIRSKYLNNIKKLINIAKDTQRKIDSNVDKLQLDIINQNNMNKKDREYEMVLEDKIEDLKKKIEVLVEKNSEKQKTKDKDFNLDDVRMKQTNSEIILNNNLNVQNKTQNS